MSHSLLFREDWHQWTKEHLWAHTFTQCTQNTPDLTELTQWKHNTQSAHLVCCHLIWVSLHKEVHYLRVLVHLHTIIRESMQSTEQYHMYCVPAGQEWKLSQIMLCRGSEVEGRAGGNPLSNSDGRGSNLSQPRTVSESQVCPCRCVHTSLQLLLPLSITHMYVIVKCHPRGVCRIKNMKLEGAKHPSTEWSKSCRRQLVSIYMIYRIAGKFHGRKFHDFVQNQTFLGFNFAISNLQKLSLAGKLLS